MWKREVCGRGVREEEGRGRCRGGKGGGGEGEVVSERISIFFHAK